MGLGLLLAAGVLPGAVAELEALDGDEIAQGLNARDDGTSMSRMAHMELIAKRGSSRAHDALPSEVRRGREVASGVLPVAEDEQGQPLTVLAMNRGSIAVLNIAGSP